MDCHRLASRAAAATAVALVAAAAAPAAPAAGPGQHPFTVAVSAKKGTESAYSFTVTAKLPPTMHVTGFVPAVRGSTHLPKGTLVEAVVAPAGSSAWKIAIVVDAVHAAGSAAGTVSGAVDLSGPLSSATVNQTRPLRLGCDDLKTLFRLSAQHANQSTAYAVWILLGPTDAGMKVEFDLSNCK